MSEAIEVVIFKAKSGTPDSQLRAAATVVTAILKEMAGFISRELGVSEDGQYIDVVHWKDLASAKAAAEKATSIPECGEFFGLIDQSQMQFMHFSKVV